MEIYSSSLFDLIIILYLMLLIFFRFSQQFLNSDFLYLLVNFFLFLILIYFSCLYPLYNNIIKFYIYYYGNTIFIPIFKIFQNTKSYKKGTSNKIEIPFYYYKTLFKTLFKGLYKNNVAITVHIKFPIPT